MGGGGGLPAGGSHNQEVEVSLLATSDRESATGPSRTSQGEQLTVADLSAVAVRSIQVCRPLPETQVQKRVSDSLARKPARAAFQTKFRG